MRSSFGDQTSAPILPLLGSKSDLLSWSRRLSLSDLTYICLGPANSFDQVKAIACPSGEMAGYSSQPFCEVRGRILKSVSSFESLWRKESQATTPSRTRQPRTALS